MTDEIKKMEERMAALLLEREQKLLASLGLETPEKIQRMHKAVDFYENAQKGASFIGKTVLRKVVGAGTLLLIGYALAKFGLTIPDIGGEGP